MTSSIKSTLHPLFSWPIDHPRSAFFLLVIVGVFIGGTLPRAKIDFSLEQLYPQDSELAHIYNEHKAAYGPDDDVFFVVREGDSWAPEIKHAEEQIRTLPQVESTRSPFSMERLENREGVLQMRPLRPDDSDVLTEGTVLSKDNGAGAIIVTIAHQHNHHEGRDALLTGVEDIINTVGGCLVQRVTSWVARRLCPFFRSPVREGGRPPAPLRRRRTSLER